MVYQVLTNASREGARTAVLDGATTNSVTTSVNSYLTAAMISGATVTVAPNPPTNAQYGDPVTVTVSIPFSQVSWLPSNVSRKPDINVGDRHAPRDKRQLGVGAESPTLVRMEGIGNDRCE